MVMVHLHSNLVRSYNYRCNVSTSVRRHSVLQQSNLVHKMNDFRHGTKQWKHFLFSFSFQLVLFSLYQNSTAKKAIEFNGRQELQDAHHYERGEKVSICQLTKKRGMDEKPKVCVYYNHLTMLHWGHNKRNNTYLVRILTKNCFYLCFLLLP